MRSKFCADIDWFPNLLFGECNIVVQEYKPQRRALRHGRWSLVLVMIFVQCYDTNKETEILPRPIRGRH